jgi:3-hydroxyisobutyrate dehydrogenase-like beta-hydroxyacid dehydrogenase
VDTTVGIIGVGRMGLPICARLSEAGVAVAATDRRPEREAAVRAAGARWAPGTPALVDAADVLVTVLPGSAELAETMASAIPALGPGTTWIDMTSAAPGLGRDLMDGAEQRGAECLEATLGGGPAAARAGTLQLLVGGRAPVLERQRPLLEALGTIEHVGDHGAGYLAKLLVNSLWFAQAVAVGESLLLGAREGIDPRRLVEVIEHSAAGSAFVRAHADDLLDGDYLTTYGLDRCCDQLDALVEIASEQGLPHELAATVQRAYRDALARYGPVDGELLAIARLEERAGLRLRDLRNEPA